MARRSFRQVDTSMPECFDMAIGLGCKDAGVYNDKGIALVRTKQYERAIECYDHACDLKPNDPAIYVKSTALNALGLNYKALECIDYAIKNILNDDSAPTLKINLYNRKATLLMELGRIEDAMECLVKMRQI